MRRYACGTGNSPGPALAAGLRRNRRRAPRVGAPGLRSLEVPAFPEIPLLHEAALPRHGSDRASWKLPLSHAWTRLIRAQAIDMPSIKASSIIRPIADWIF